MKEIISTSTLLLMGFYGIFLYLNNNLGFYIHPRFFEESLVASIVALLIGIASLVDLLIFKRKDLKKLSKLFNNKILLIFVLIILSFIVSSFFLVIAAFLIFLNSDKFQDFFKSDVVGNLLLFLTIGIALLLPAKSLSSLTASQRSIDLNSINLTGSTKSTIQNFSKSTINYSLGDWIAIMNYNPDPLYYQDKELKVSGFIYRPDNLDLSNDMVLVARFIVTCCAVDARPVGLKMKLDSSIDFKQDDWVEVTGKFNLTEKQEIYIEPSEIKKIEVPNNPYIF